MPARTGVHAATSRVVCISVILASLTIAFTMTAVAAVTAVTEQVYRDKGDGDHHPEPVGRKPCHNVFSFRCVVAPPR
jgi:hypothetical protein